MDIRRLKLALTVELLNQPFLSAPFHSAKSTLQHFTKETGDFLGFTESSPKQIGNGMEQITFALQYEKVTLNLDLVTNGNSKEQYLHSFNLRENFA